MSHNSADNQTVSIEKISTKSIIWITLAFSAVVLILYHFSLPFFAERHFRDGFNLTQMRRYKFAIEELETAVALAPWETHYMVQLGKAYERFADQQKTKEAKIEYIMKAVRLYKKK